MAYYHALLMTEIVKTCQTLYRDFISFRLTQLTEGVIRSFLPQFISQKLHILTDMGNWDWTEMDAPILKMCLRPSGTTRIMQTPLGQYISISNKTTTLTINGLYCRMHQCILIHNVPLLSPPWAHLGSFHNGTRPIQAPGQGGMLSRRQRFKSGDGVVCEEGCHSHSHSRTLSIFF